jgi:Na+-transporting NADH:ubiquinone oxidoreductase subunit NqrB
MTPGDPAAQASRPGGTWPLPARRGEMLVAAAVLAAGLFFVWQAVSLPLGTARLPGPGFFPLALGAALGLLAAAVLVRALRDRAPRDSIPFGHRDVLVVMAALIGAVIGFERLGSYLTLGLLMAVLLLLVARTAPWRAVLGAIVGSAAVWVVFRILLGVQLPAGPF